MKIKKKNIIMYLIILYFLFFTLIASSYFLFTKSFFNSFAKDYASINQIVYSNNLSSYLKEEQSLYLNDMDSKLAYDEGIVDDNKINYNSIYIDLEDNYLSSYNFVIKQERIFLLKDKEYRTIPVKDIINKVIPNTLANNILLMDNTGYIYYNEKSNEDILNNYLAGNTTTYFDKYFKLNNNGVVKDKHKDKDIFLSFATLKDFSNLYLMESFLKSELVPIYAQYDIMFIIGLVTYTLIVVLVQIYIFRSVHIKNAEIENSKIRYVYSKPYLIKINSKGIIRRVNKKMLEVSKDISHIKNVNDLTLNNPTEEINNLMDYVKKEKAFTINVNNKLIRFIPLKYSMGYHLIGEELKDRQDNIDEIRKMAYFDRITKLPNLSYYRYKLNSYINDNSFDYTKTALVILDVKDFDFYNKVFGRSTSDTILYHIGQFVKREVEGLEIDLYNAQQDKFLLIFKNINNRKDVTDFINNMYNKLSKPLKVEENLINVDFTVGIYYFEDYDITSDAVDRVYESLLVALERAKDSGISSYIIYDESLRLYVSKRNEMAADLVKAIEEEEIIVYLQPQYDNRKERIIGFEALARWDNPKYINSSPQEFITIAEKKNMIIDIGNLVMKQTFEVAKKLEKYNLTISLNVSPVQILQDGFVNEFLSVYNSYNLKPGSIAVEITENFLITSLRKVNAKLKILKNNGIEISLDDFGTGYSSLPYLRELQVDTIKIDRTFVQYLETDKQDREIVKMLIGLISNLGFDIIAEGIEDEYQNNFLYKNGCDVIQGFILSKAVPYNQALILLEDYNINKTKKLVVEKKRRGRL